MEKLFEICQKAMDEAERAGENWADYVDAALIDAGYPVRPDIARKLAERGQLDVVAVIGGEYFEDGIPGVVSRGDNGAWCIENLEEAG